MRIRRVLLTVPAGGANMGQQLENPPSMKKAHSFESLIDFSIPARQDSNLRSRGS